MISGIFRLDGDETERSTVRFAAVLAGAGLLNALIAAVLLCRLPPSATPTLSRLLARAAIYVVMAAVAGAAATWFYWRRSSSHSKMHFPVSIGTFGVACVAGWVWVPAVVILVDEESAAAAVIAAMGALILGVAVRGMIPASLHDPREGYFPKETERELFAEVLRAPAFRSDGYAIALLVYSAALAGRDRSIYLACVLLSAAAFMFSWEWTSAAQVSQHQRQRVRLPWVVLAAFVVTAWALLDGVAHRSRVIAENVALARASDAARDDANTKDSNSRSARGGYESIILWPLPPKLQIIPPLPARRELLAPGTTRPIVIRFDGPYWYFQPPETKPGPHAHQARGTPLEAHIRSNNMFPLSMEAHQSLSSAIRLSRCREVEIEIENSEVTPNPVAVALLLTDSTAPGKPTIYLGQQVLKTSLPDHAVTGAPYFETLRFEIPALAKIRKFDEINVMVLPDVGPALVGPKIAIQQFQLFPR